MKQKTSISLSEETKRQIAELEELWGEKLSEVVARSVNASWLLAIHGDTAAKVSKRFDDMQKL